MRFLDVYKQKNRADSAIQALFAKLHYKLVLFTSAKLHIVWKPKTFHLPFGKEVAFIGNQYFFMKTYHSMRGLPGKLHKIVNLYGLM